MHKGELVSVFGDLRKGEVRARWEHLMIPGSQDE